MVSKYSKEFEVPKDFPSVLKAFSREVLRNQPENIYEFGAEYFATLLSEAAAQEAGTGGTAQERLTPEQLEGLLKDLFKEADTDQSGALSMKEFKEVIRLANLGLSDREVGRLLAEADVNQDGEIDYEEFVPIAVDLVQGLYARMESAAEDEVAAVQAQQEAELLIRGMDKAELQKIMMDVFNKADADGSGQLSLAEFQTCIKEADLGLTRREINVLMTQVDVDGSGYVEYSEFAPLCFEILTKILREELVDALRPPTELEAGLYALFSEHDAEKGGVLPLATLRDLVKTADLGLTRLQIHTVLAEAEENADGLVSYATFAHRASSVIYKLLDPKMMKERKAALAGAAAATVNGAPLAPPSPPPEVPAPPPSRSPFSRRPPSAGLSEDELAQQLMAAFVERDSVGAGTLPVAELRGALSSWQTGSGGSEKDLVALMSAVEVDQFNNVEYAPLAAYAFRILSHMQSFS